MLDNQFSPNDILLTSTSLVEASRLVSGVPSESNSRRNETMDVHRLVEFCNVVESVVLNDRIFILDGLLPNDEEGLHFASSLIENGIIERTVLDGVTESATRAAYEMLGDIGNNRVYGEAIVNGCRSLPEDWGHDRTERVWNHSPLESWYSPQLVFDEDFRKSNSYFAGSERMTWIEEIQDHLGNMVSPNTDYTIEQIRGVFYWSLAEQARLAFSPDLTRATWLSKWLYELKKSLSQEIYREVAAAFVADAEDLLRIRVQPNCFCLPFRPYFSTVPILKRLS